MALSVDALFLQAEMAVFDSTPLPSLIVKSVFILLLLIAGCGEPAPKSDAELGLNAQQIRGRRIFESDCAACHYAYSSSSNKAPGLKHLFKKQFLPSGLPANDRFVEQTIVGGRNMMPSFGGALTDQQLDDLLAYLHTL